MGAARSIIGRDARAAPSVRSAGVIFSGAHEGFVANIDKVTLTHTTVGAGREHRAF